MAPIRPTMAAKAPPAAISGSWRGSPTSTSFCPRPPGGFDQRGQVPRPDHARLVEDNHIVRRELDRTVSRVPREDGPRCRTRCRPPREVPGPPGPTSAVPITLEPCASQAVRAAAKASVLPDPAFPTTTSAPWPEVASRRTMSTCSGARSGNRRERRGQRCRR